MNSVFRQIYFFLREALQNSRPLLVSRQHLFQKLEIHSAQIKQDLINIGSNQKAKIYKLHGKYYLLTSKTCKVLDISSALNYQEPKEKANIIYKND